MSSESKIPPAPDPEKAEHYAFEKYLYLVRNWIPHHIEGRWFYPQGGMVDANTMIAARRSWGRAVCLAWARGQAVNLDALADFPGLLRKSVRNGMWGFRKGEHS